MLEGCYRTLEIRQTADQGRDYQAESWSYKLLLQRLLSTPRTAGAATLRATLCDLLRFRDCSNIIITACSVQYKHIETGAAPLYL